MARNILAIGIVLFFLGIVCAGLGAYYVTRPSGRPQTLTSVVSTSAVAASSSISLTSSFSTTSPGIHTQTLKTRKVIEVVDGDTVALSDDSTVRLLGINAPEEGYPLYREAKNRLSSLILNKDVRLESDREDKDRYGRLLRYIFIDDTCVNVQMVKEGWASVFMEEGLRYESRLREAEVYAKLHNLGIWEKNVAYAEYIYVAEFHYDAAGDDGKNLNDEYVILGNKGDTPIDMTGWTIKDEANNVFTFSSFILEQGDTVKICSGSGLNTPATLYWRSTKAAIWNNDGDTLYLKNADGDLILSHSYP